MNFDRPLDTGIDIGGDHGVFGRATDTEIDIGIGVETAPTPVAPSPLGAGYLILVVRELTGTT